MNPPCEGCHNATRCASEQLACEAYYVYASGQPRRGRAPMVLPLPEWWAAAMADDDSPGGGTNAAYSRAKRIQNSWQPDVA